MAREYFCAYHSYLQTIEELSLEERGMLFTACLAYSATGETPALSGFAKAVFPGIRAQIDRDRMAFENRCKTQADNANKRWHANESQSMPRHANESQSMPRHATAYDGMPMDAKHAKEKDKESISISRNSSNLRNSSITQDSSKESVQESINSADKPRRFTKPTVEDISAYCKERGNTVEPQRFYDFYEAKGWYIGKNPMKDWKAAVRTWEQKDGERKPNQFTPEQKKQPKPRTFVLTEDGGLKYDDEP